MCLFASNVVVVKLLCRGMMKWLGVMHFITLLFAEAFVRGLLFIISSTLQMNVIDCLLGPILGSRH